MSTSSYELSLMDAPTALFPEQKLNSLQRILQRHQKKKLFILIWRVSQRQPPGIKRRLKPQPPCFMTPLWPEEQPTLTLHNFMKFKRRMGNNGCSAATRMSSGRSWKPFQSRVSKNKPEPERKQTAIQFRWKTGKNTDSKGNFVYSTRPSLFSLCRFVWCCHVSVMCAARRWRKVLQFPRTTMLLGIILLQIVIWGKFFAELQILISVSNWSELRLNLIPIFTQFNPNVDSI